MISNSKWDYVFICSNVPPPRSIEKCKQIIKSGKKLLLVYIQRPGFFFKSDDIIGCDILKYKVSYKGSVIHRAFSMLFFSIWLTKNVFSNCELKYDLYVDSLDLLFIATRFKSSRVTVRYEVRDLNAVHFGHTLFASFVRSLEESCLKKTDRLILTSDYYYKHYYSRVFDGLYSIVENMPDIGFWDDNVKESDRDSTFIIGYVGVFRYFRCIETLLQACCLLKNDGYNVRVDFYGVGDISGILKKIGSPNWVVEKGPFNSKDLPGIYNNIDLSFAVYDTAYTNVIYALPNKLYESILSETPIIVSTGTFLESKVNDLSIGVGCDPYDEIELKNTLLIAISNAGWFLNSKNKLRDIEKPQKVEYNSIIRKAMID